MVSIGDTILKIKQMRGYSVKQITKNVISKSEYYRIINGERGISAEKLFLLLENLNISIKEFTYLANNDNFTQFNNPFLQIQKYFLNKNSTKLLAISKDNSDKYLKTELIRYKHISLCAEACYKRLNYKSTFHSNAQYELSSYLLQLNELTLYDMLLFNNTMFILPKNISTILAKNIYHELPKYNRFSEQTSLLFMILVNIAILSIQHKQPLKNHVHMMNKIKLGEQHILEKMYLYFFNLLIQITPVNSRHKEVEQLFNFMKDLNMNVQKDLLGNIYVNFCNSIDSARKINDKNYKF